MTAQWTQEDRREFDAQCSAMADANILKMRQVGFWEYASPKEQAFLHSFGSKMDECAHVAAGWRMECVAMLAWALRLIEEWPPIDTQIGVDLLERIPSRKISLFATYPSLRDDQEIRQKRDLIEFWHWRVRTRQLIELGSPFEPDEQMRQAGMNSYDDIVRIASKKAYANGALPEILEEDFVFMGKPFRSLPAKEYQIATSIIMERHHALNWLCGLAPGNRWDETPTGT
jgi:hypothetical protein